MRGPPGSLGEHVADIIIDGLGAILENAMKKQRARFPRNAKPDDPEIHNHLRTTQQGYWLAVRTRPDLSCHTRLAQQCMPKPTVGRIRKG